jgi:hypothetical protein
MTGQLKSSDTNIHHCSLSLSLFLSHDVMMILPVLICGFPLNLGQELSTFRGYSSFTNNLPNFP